MNVLHYGFILAAAILLGSYWLMPSRARSAFLALYSIFILACFSIWSACAMLLITSTTYLAIRYTHQNGGLKVLGFIVLVGGFSLYKTTQAIHPGEGVLLIGLSFYVLKALHVLIERFKGNYRQISFVDFTAYMMFLPSLLIGPIHRLEQFKQDQMRQYFDWPRTSFALERLIWGYAKIVLLAGYLISIKLHDLNLSLQHSYPWLHEYLLNIEYGLHLYFSFSGASDIAIGLAAIIGFKLPENFHWPFASRNIAEFWRRWHMTLASWCRDYIYRPVIAISRNHQFAIILTMLIIGLWHEYSSRYVLWGLYHGAGLAIFYNWQNFKQSLFHKKSLSSNGSVSRSVVNYASHAVAVFITFNFVMLSFAITRSKTLSEIGQSFSVLLLGGG